MLTMAALAQRIRFSKVVSCGNECDLNAVDFLEYLGQDPETRIIIAYLEAIKDGRRFYQLAREISKEKPIIVLKGGTTERGARAAASHTGALAGSNRIWRAVFAQTGIISAHSAEEMLDYLQAFYYLPLPEGRRVGIVSGPGGPAVTASDACIESGLELAELSQHTKRRIAELIPPVGTSIDNPIDLGMGAAFSPQSYVESIRALGEDKGVDILLIIGASWHPKFIEMMLEAVREVDKPAAFATMPSLSMETEQSLPTRGLAIYPDGRRAAMSLGKLVEYRRFRSGA
jgi:acyl-CoA synthetase (NDP forming)